MEWYLCSWIGGTGTVKRTIIPEEIYRFNAIPIKISQLFFFYRLEQTSFKTSWKNQSSWIAKIILRNNKVGGVTHPGFKLYHKATVIKIIWYRHKNRYIDQWNRIKSQEMNPYFYKQLTYDKRLNKIYNGEKMKIGQQHTRESNWTTFSNK